MSEESTTPDLVERTRRGFDAGSRQDVEAVMSDYGPESVWDMSPVGLGVYEGQVAIRCFLEDWCDPSVDPLAHQGPLGRGMAYGEPPATLADLPADTAALALPVTS
jgi:hypothetical protein